MTVQAAPDTREQGGPYCDQCGRPDAEPEHLRCAGRRVLEPPRFCPDCARRMVVQIDPVGWTARCSRHGNRHS